LPETGSQREKAQREDQPPEQPVMVAVIGHEEVAAVEDRKGNQQSVREKGF
jgi:hypothetical protein